jgi:polyisoprenoid-binding protein YceI
MRIAFALLLAPAMVGNGLSTLEPAPGSYVKVEVEKTGLYKGKKHLFSFTSWRGQVEYDPQHPESATARLEIDAGQFKLEDEWVSEKDRKKISEFTRSKEMLEVSSYPQIVFHGAGLKPDGPGRWKITGDLTIRNVTKPVELALALDGKQATGRAVFPMTAFGLKPPKALLGAIGTKDEIVISFSVTAK